jgi:hypothetical protein
VSQPLPQPRRARRPRDPLSRPHIAEWFGHRVFPLVDASPNALNQQKSGLCPFLSDTLAQPKTCVKKENSRGVCTISAGSNGPRQDWLVCPYRALDHDLLAAMVRRLYQVPDETPLLIRPAKALEAPEIKREVLLAVNSPEQRRVFLYFQDILGGEIALAPTSASPELSFDITVIELLPAQNPQLDLTGEAALRVQVGKYGVIELQTTDTHGTYMNAVTALTNALDLHGAQFPQLLAENPEWAGRKVEGPNISNVFKRTFYQIAFKFQITKRDTSAGCVLALPKPVWDSWQPFLGAPQLRQKPDGTWRLLDDHETTPVDWIYVFDIEEQPGPDGEPAQISIPLVIGTDAATLSHAALDIAPAKAVEHGQGTDAVLSTITRRLLAYLPEIA